MDFYGKFTTQYQKIKTLLGLGYEKIKKREGEGEEKEELEELPPEMQTCMILLVKLYNKGKMSKSGRLARTTIEAISKEFSLGISNLNDLYDIMQKYDILIPKPSMINFSEDLLNIDHLENIMKICENKFRKKKINLNSFQ